MFSKKEYDIQALHLIIIDDIYWESDSGENKNFGITNFLLSNICVDSELFYFISHLLFVRVMIEVISRPQTFREI